MRKLNEKEIEILKGIEKESGYDLPFWDKMAEIYQNDDGVLKRIKFEEDYCRSVKAIPVGYNCHWKTQRTYMDTVEQFCIEAGYPNAEEVEEFEDSILEKIAERFGIDIDINGDGMTSFEKYRKNR